MIAAHAASQGPISEKQAAELREQADGLRKQRLQMQEANNPRGEAMALASIATLTLMTSDLKESLEVSTAAREVAEKCKDVDGELRYIVLAGHTHLALGEADKAFELVERGLELCQKAREASFAAPARAAVERLAGCAGAMTSYHGGGGSLATAGAYCALAHLEVAHGNFEAALSAGKLALDCFESSAERGGMAAASLALAQAHVAAGAAEDQARFKYFLPPATRHAAAAGHHARRAMDICSRCGSKEGVKSAQAVLDLERVRRCSAIPGNDFSYSTWKHVNP